MLKKACIRAASGFAYGILIGQSVSIMISLGFGDGTYHAVIPEFSALFNTEITAVIVQMILRGILGAAFAATSIIFEMEKWSILKQYVLHFFITAAFWVPIVYFCWMPRNAGGVLIFLANFVGVYAIIWLVQYFIAKNDVKKINEKINALNNQVEF